MQGSHLRERYAHTAAGLIIAIEIFMGKTPGKRDELRRRLWARDEKTIDRS